jgi:cell division protein FtsB
MLGENTKRAVSARAITVLFLLACLIGLSLSAAFLFGHAIYKKQFEDKDRQVLAAEKNNEFLSDKNVELQNSLQKLEDAYSSLESRYKDLVASSLLAQHMAAMNTKSSSAGSPPIEQPLVREGEFAVELATAFNLTSSYDEAAAESYLASLDIAPKNGWISDYPMTPDIIAEVKESVAISASSGYLQISETDAVGLVDNVSISMNLPVKEGYESSSEYQSHLPAPRPDASEYVEASVLEDYYDGNKPPAVTYYPPPLEYAYLYDWVPSPFWWEGFRFTGFFILVDFDRHYHHHPITNHVTNANGTVTRINATTRASASVNRQTAPKANAANTADDISVSLNLTSSVPARDTDRTMRNPGNATHDKETSTSSPRAGEAAASRFPSYDGRTFNSAPSPRFSPGGGYGGWSDSGPKGDGVMRGFLGNGLAGGGHR